MPAGPRQGSDGDEQQSADEGHESAELESAV